MFGESPCFRLKRGDFFKVTKKYSVFCYIYDRKCANVWSRGDFHEMS